MFALDNNIFKNIENTYCTYIINCIFLNTKISNSVFDDDIIITEIIYYNRNNNINNYSQILRFVFVFTYVVIAAVAVIKVNRIMDSSDTKD